MGRGVAKRNRSSSLWLASGAALAFGCGAPSGLNDPRIVEATGGKAAGGTWATGGTAPTGGARSMTGGTTSMTGGTAPTGGTATGGTYNPTGGTAPTGGKAPTGGWATGGTYNPTGGTSSGGECGGSGSLAMKAGGFVVGSGWQGYAWTAAVPPGSSTVAPADFSTCSASMTAVCASGNVAAMSDYSGTGALVVNLNQAEGSSIVGAFTPTGSGVTVNVTNRGGSAVRVQIQAPGGDTDATKRWCAPLTTFGSSVTIPWSAFNTKCWDGSGTTYTVGTAIQAIMIVVPGTNTAGVSFSFCLNDLSF
jgi:hypothetical protein